LFAPPPLKSLDRTELLADFEFGGCEEFPLCWFGTRELKIVKGLPKMNFTQKACMG